MLPELSADILHHINKLHNLWTPLKLEFKLLYYCWRLWNHTCRLSNKIESESNLELALHIFKIGLELNCRILRDDFLNPTFELAVLECHNNEHLFLHNRSSRDLSKGENVAVILLMFCAIMGLVHVVDIDGI